MALANACHYHVLARVKAKSAVSKGEREMSGIRWVLACLLVVTLSGCKSDSDMDDQIISKERQTSTTDDADENDQD